MGRLYNRGAKLTAWRAQPDRFFDAPGAYNAIVIEGLQITFRVDLAFGSDPSKAEISVTNAGPEIRGFLAQQPLSVRLELGYDGELHQIFAGDLRWVISNRSGVDWMTTLQVADGGRAYTTARVSESLGETATALDAIERCARALQLVLPRELLDDPELSAPVAGGAALVGPAAATLTRLLAPYGYKWQVQGGRLVVLRAAQTSGLTYQVTPENGLIGSPEIAAPDRSGDRPKITVRTLLDPRITPKCRIDLRTQSQQGVYQVGRVYHSGDSLGGDFMTEFEATPV